VGWLGRKTGLRENQGRTRAPFRVRPAWLLVGDFCGFAEEFFAGGQAAAALADILEVFEFALAKMLLKGIMLNAAVTAFIDLALRIA
jgi:hypothetical protein